ncbi:hypothetical protein CBW65_19555 [Tumebacillus avium]|uniref:Uncharacterized protein n=2 Tax=Tumebacillus avium TaxID=1903704 RepID=A0A1Y0IQY7_9BACL|nr:hypothetical protein CBW65_19555 [Tumebacillus avium]
MGIKENSLASHFEANYGEQQKLIDFLKTSYSIDEILSIGRMLGFDKDDYYSRNMTKKQLAGEFIDVVAQRSCYDQLFFILNSREFFRERLLQTFIELGPVKPLTSGDILDLTKKGYNEQKVNTDLDYQGWIERCKQKMVLVLGKDNTIDAFERLEYISVKLEELGYEPIIIKKQAEIDALYNEEKMLMYASLSRFIIIEKSEAAGQIDEARICATNRFVCAWLQKENTGDTWMQGDYEHSFTNVKVFKYSEDELSTAVSHAAIWAEKYLVQKEDELNALYPWRNKGGIK